MNDVQGMETLMLTRLRKMMKRITAPSAAEIEGQALLARLDGEIATLREVLQRADAAVGAGWMTMARARLNMLKEAAIAARALRPEHLCHCQAMKALCESAGMPVFLQRVA
ncbi:MAG: hypothetical protein MUD11_08360 [Rhodobacteraceae bacterium]|nr:hypothetical protein [Paracoccaceae bacterium]